MKQKTIVHVVKNHTGPILMNVSGPIDGLYVQIVKADLLWKLENHYNDNELCGLSYVRRPGSEGMKGCYLYLDADFSE